MKNVPRLSLVAKIFSFPTPEMLKVRKQGISLQFLLFWGYLFFECERNCIDYLAVHPELPSLFKEQHKVIKRLWVQMFLKDHKKVHFSRIKRAIIELFHRNGGIEVVIEVVRVNLLLLLRCVKVVQDRRGLAFNYLI